jgi:hypothetical protein
MLAKQMVFFVSTCNNKLQQIFPSKFDSKSTEKSNIKIIVDVENHPQLAEQECRNIK